MKQTEIGLIPDDWEVKTLGEVATFLDSKRIPITESERKKGIYPYYGASGIIDYVNNYIFDGDYVLLGEDGANIVDRNSRLAFVVHGKCWINNHAHVLHPNEDMDLDFLSEYLESLDYTSYNTGTAQPKLNREKCNSIPVIKPPLAEQRRIAKALSDVDALISTTEKLIQKKKNFKQGTMQILLTGKKRLPGFAKSTNDKQSELGLIPEDWEVMSLGEFCQIKDGTHGTYARVENGYLLLSAKNILNGKLDIQENESLISENAYAEIVKNGFPKKNDLLISCVGTIGRCCIFDTDEKIAFQRSVAFIRQNQIDNLFLMYFIQSDLFQKQLREAVNASTLGGVYLGAFNPLQISFSSDKKEQTAIANVLSSMDKEIETLNTKLEKYRNLKTAMMQQLLTGKIRLVK